MRISATIPIANATARKRHRVRGQTPRLDSWGAEINTMTAQRIPSVGRSHRAAMGAKAATAITRTATEISVAI